MFKHLGGWFGLTGILALVVLGVSLLATAGPLSDVEIAQRIRGIPTETQGMSCTTTSATATNAIGANSLVRIAVEGTVGINYSFGAAGAGVALNGGPFLPGNTVEMVQNGSNQYFFCITRSGTSTPTLSIMR